MSGDVDLLLWSAAVLALVLAAYGLTRADGRWIQRLRSAFARGRAAIAGIVPALRGGAMSVGGIAPALRRGAMSIGGIAPALRRGAMSVGGIAPALRRGAMSIGGIAPALRRGAMSVSRAWTALLRRLQPRAALPVRRRLALAPLRRRDRSRSATECAYPIVLAHGWMGLDGFDLPGVLRPEYFRGVREHLQASGHCVYVSRVSPFAGVGRRAEQFAEQLAKIDAEKVNIIAHSMGGLDARYAISRLGLAGRVASLTTIGTPHRGTPLADTSRILRELPLLRRALLSQLGLDFDGIHDLTTEQMTSFNDKVPDMRGVRYASYVGWVPGGVRDVHALLAPGFAYLSRRTGHNDGMVPAVSQRWGNVLGEVHADHWAQIGWSRGLDAKDFYAEVARSLARSGL